MTAQLDSKDLCATVHAEARRLGYELKLDALDVPLRYAWQWVPRVIFTGVVPLTNRREGIFPSRAEAEFCACLELAQLHRWTALRLPEIPPMELARPIIEEPMP